MKDGDLYWTLSKNGEIIKTSIVYVCWDFLLDDIKECMEEIVEKEYDYTTDLQINQGERRISINIDKDNYIIEPRIYEEPYHLAGYGDIPAADFEGRKPLTPREKIKLR